MLCLGEITWALKRVSECLGYEIILAKKLLICSFQVIFVAHMAFIATFCYYIVLNLFVAAYIIFYNIAVKRKLIVKQLLANSIVFCAQFYNGSCNGK